MQIDIIDSPFSYFSLGLSPQDADMAITSTSEMGTIGALNRLVINAYGYTDAFDSGVLPIKDGYYWLQQTGRKPVLFIATVGKKETNLLLIENLHVAIRDNLDKMAGKKVWLPLMGTGIGKLSLHESLSIQKDVLNRLRVGTEPLKISFLLAIPDSEEGRALANTLPPSIRRLHEVPDEKKIKNGLLAGYLKTAPSKFYLVGTMSKDNKDIRRFAVRSLWEAVDEKLTDTDKETLLNIVPGDFVVLRSRYDDNKRIKVHAIGKVTANPQDGYHLSVKWLIRDSFSLEGVEYPKDVVLNLKDARLMAILAIYGWDRLLAAGVVGNTNGLQELPLPTSRITIPGFNSDADSGGDYLGIAKDVNGFARIMAAKSFKPPLAVALFGQYGAGKSFFMQKLKDEIKRLSGPQASDIYCKGIVQIHFNSWSYMDANLWASIVTRIFDELNRYIADEEITGEIKRQIKQELSQKLIITQEEINILERKKEVVSARLVELQLEKEQLNTELNSKVAEIRNHSLSTAIANINEQFDVDSRIAAALESNPSYGRSVEELRQIIPDEFWKNPDVLYREIRSGYIFLREFFKWKKIRWNILILGVILVIIFSLKPIIDLSIQRLEYINFTIPQVALSSLAVGVSYWNRWKKTYDGLRPVIASFWNIKNDYDKRIATVKEAYMKRSEELRSELESKQRQIVIVDDRMQKAAIEIADLDFRINNALATEVLHSFIERRSKSDDYKKHLGLISVIQRDFEVLSKLFDEHNEEAKAVEFRDKFKKPLNRIILYIDDLDRCSEERIVEVVGAVNLLMAFPLFIVVVGMDPRWVKNALVRHYKNQLVDHHKTNIPGNESISAANYLEKIFQVPFHLKEATDDNVKDMLESLIRPDNEDYSKPAVVENSGKSFSNLEIQSGGPSTETVTLMNNGNLTDHRGDNHSDLAEIERPEDLIISEMEINLMKGLSPAIGTNPRSIKRFVNIYRIVKAHESLSYDKINEATELQVLMLLLALTTGPYKSLKESFHRYVMSSASNGASMNDFLRYSEEGGAAGPLINRLNGQLTSNSADLLRMIPIAAFKRHLEFIERFTFD